MSETNIVKTLLTSLQDLTLRKHRRFVELPITTIAIHPPEKPVNQESLFQTGSNLCTDILLLLLGRDVIIQILRLWTNAYHRLHVRVISMLHAKIITKDWWINRCPYP